jgi:hypothetical protein
VWRGRSERGRRAASDREGSAPPGGDSPLLRLRPPTTARAPGGRLPPGPSSSLELWTIRFQQKSRARLLRDPALPHKVRPYERHRLSVVPVVAGEQPAIARAELRKAGLLVGQVRKPRGVRGRRLVVVAERPAAGRRVPKGTRILLRLGAIRH